MHISCIEMVMSKGKKTMRNNGSLEMQNALYGVQSELIQSAIRKAQRERSKALRAILQQVFGRREDHREADKSSAVPSTGDLCCGQPV